MWEKVSHRDVQKREGEEETSLSPPKLGEWELLTQVERTGKKTKKDLGSEKVSPENENIYIKN